MVRRADVLAYLDRPWDLLRESKDRYTASLVEKNGPGAAFELAAMLAMQAEAMGATVTTEERAADLEHAVRLKKRLDRASARRSRRAR